MGDSQFNGTQEEWDALIKKNKSKTMTAVDWIVDQMLSEGHKEMWKDMIQQAKQMEKDQMQISDEEIDKQAEPIELGIHRMFFKTGAKWYREQLKKK